MDFNIDCDLIVIAGLRLFDIEISVTGDNGEDIYLQVFFNAPPEEMGQKKVKEWEAYIHNLICEYLHYKDTHAISSQDCEQWVYMRVKEDRFDSKDNV